MREGHHVSGVRCGLAHLFHRFGERVHKVRSSLLDLDLGGIGFCHADPLWIEIPLSSVTKVFSHRVEQSRRLVGDSDDKTNHVEEKVDDLDDHCVEGVQPREALQSEEDRKNDCSEKEEQPEDNENCLLRDFLVEEVYQLEPNLEASTEK